MTIKKWSVRSGRWGYSHVDIIEEDESDQLANRRRRDELLKYLFSRTGRLAIDLVVELCSLEVLFQLDH